MAATLKRRTSLACGAIYETYNWATTFVLAGWICQPLRLAQQRSGCSARDERIYGWLSALKVQIGSGHGSSIALEQLDFISLFERQ